MKPKTILRKWKESEFMAPDDLLCILNKKEDVVTINEILEVMDKLYLKNPKKTKDDKQKLIKHPIDVDFRKVLVYFD